MDEWYALTRQEAAALVALKRRLNPSTSAVVRGAWDLLCDLETWITEQEAETVDLGASTSDGPESGVDLGRALP